MRSDAPGIISPDHCALILLPHFLQAQAELLQATKDCLRAEQDIVIGFSDSLGRNGCFAQLCALQHH